jgi:hypothetical protein
MLNGLMEEYGSELALLADVMPDAGSDAQMIENIWRLMERHGENVAAGRSSNARTGMTILSRRFPRIPSWDSLPGENI